MNSLTQASPYSGCTSFRPFILLTVAFLLFGLLSCTSATDVEYDLVILNGRVMDPETDLDATRHLGITNGKIEAVSEKPLRGRTVVEANGLIVSPGFIDLHAHGQDDENYRAYAMDGVTSALELEIGTADIDNWYDEREGKALIHYGVSIGHPQVRMRVMNDPGTFLPTGEAANRAATEEEIEQIKQGIRQGLERGAAAVGFGVAYTYAATYWEIIEAFHVAAEFGAPSHVHIREGESGIQGLQEVLAAAAVTGAPVHVVHINSSGMWNIPRLLEMIDQARSRGIDITTECYPYTAGMTLLESALFNPGWRKKRRLEYSDLQWVATGERLNEKSFAKYRKQGGMIILHTNPEELVTEAVISPLTIIASDALLEDGKGHPRTFGTYARVLGRYVREKKKLNLMDALRKMTLMPAQRLEGRVPAMKNKGRIRLGADADLAVFDPEQIIDKATYENSTVYSEGIQYVFVNGEPVVEDGKLVEGTSPGQPIRAPIK